MKTYYCVTSAFYDDGRVTAGITASIKAETKPEDTFTETRYKDIYNNWFDNYANAQQFVKDAKMA